MSDEAGAATKSREDTALYVHYCEEPGCTKWGSFGFAIGRGEPNWFCFEHKPELKSCEEDRPGWLSHQEVPRQQGTGHCSKLLLK